MIDLERVRKALEFGQKQGWSPHHDTLWDRGLENLDAHLEEDEERKAEQRRVVMSLYDELAEWKQVLNERSAELADLKKDYIRLREGVRRWYVNALPEVSEADLDSLLELIEEKE